MLPNISHISPYLTYQSQEAHHSELCMEEVVLKQLVQQYATPLFVYSTAHISECLSLYTEGLKAHQHAIYYSVKVNSNIHLLALLHRLGARFDVVSQGELQRVIQAGASAKHCAFAGVGKTQEELLFALRQGIGCINVESVSELHRLNALAKSNNIIASISLRINPNVDAQTHPYISTGLRENKFGILTKQAYELYQWASQQPNLQIKGVSCHIGSQLLDLSPLIQTAQKMVEFAGELSHQGIMLEHISFGGGIGISYQPEDGNKITITDWQNYFSELTKIVPQNIAIHLEPGRSIVGNGGVLLTQVQYIKQQGEKLFAIVDAAMNDLIRPTLYSANHQVVELQLQKNDRSRRYYHVVGPVCESGDFLAHDKPLSIQEGDYLAVLSAGAYGFCMSSNYNTRPRAAEVLVNGAKSSLIRQRETFKDIIANELLVG